MGLHSAIYQEHLLYDMRKISIRELFFLKFLPFNLYSYTEGLFKVNVTSGTAVTMDLLRLFLVSETWFFYIQKKDYDEHKLIQRRQLRDLSRSLSVGHPSQKAIAITNLLGLNLNYFYQDTTDDELLQLIFQVVKNMAQFFGQNQDYLSSAYRELLTGKHHYKISQPILSALLLLGFLIGQRVFTAKEIENLFLTAILKDVGMGLIPEEKFYKKNLNKEEIELLSAHAEHSEKILEGRIPLTPEYLQIISRHHQMGNSSLEKVENSAQLCGVETLLITITDIVCAITTDRPYRKKEGIFPALEKIRPLMGKEYSQEFKFLVQYCRNFFN